MSATFRTPYYLVVAAFSGACHLFAQELAIELAAENSVDVSWSSVSDRQYQLYCSDDLAQPLNDWDELGNWFAGDGSVLSVSDVIASPGRKFYVLEARTKFTIDIANYGYGSVGNSWTYQITDSRESAPFQATYVVDARQEFPASSGQQVIRVSATRADDTAWAQSLYILDDFSEGLFQVGGINPSIEQFPGVFENTSIASTPAGASVAPLLLNEFVPDVSLDWDYHHSNFNDLDNEVTHTLSSFILPGDVEPTTAIKVTSSFTSEITVMRYVVFLGNIEVEVDVSSTVEDYYVDGVGLVKKVVSIDAVPQESRYIDYAEYIDVTYELQSFSRVD